MLLLKNSDCRAALRDEKVQLISIQPGWPHLCTTGFVTAPKLSQMLRPLSWGDDILSRDRILEISFDLLHMFSYGCITRWSLSCSSLFNQGYFCTALLKFYTFESDTDCFWTLIFMQLTGDNLLKQFSSVSFYDTVCIFKETFDFADFVSLSVDLWGYKLLT